MSDAELSGPPPSGTSIPELVRDHAGHAGLSGVWLNQRGGLTFRAGERYLKWSPPGVDLTGEMERFTWAGTWHSVPEVIEFVDGDERGQVLVTQALRGSNAVDERWQREPRRAAWAIGEALRALHEQLPVAACPFLWYPIQEAELPSVDHLVVCHGDPCAPNTILADDGRWVGHVDLGRLGVGDRWVDLAVGSANLDDNFGPGHQEAYFEAYGIDRDEDRIRFYRRLWDTAP
jgi:kanamycin kinase